MIRVHKTGTDTLVDTLPTTKSGDTLTFKTDRFSTYAIVYAEPQDTSSGGNSGGNSGGSSGGGNSGGASATPEQPGDTGKTDDTEKPSETPDSGDQSDFSGNQVSKLTLATVYKGNIIKNLIMDCQSYTKYRPNETTGGIFVSWRRKEELPTGA